MTVTVKFGNNNEAINKISKTFDIRGGVSCTVKDDVSVENPMFLVTAASVSPSNNYCYCADLGNRYYYITDIIDLPGDPGRRLVSCTVDPLKTYETSIKDLEVFVDRSESTKESLLYDGMTPQTADKYEYIKAFSGSLPKISSDSDRCYVLLVGC